MKTKNMINHRRTEKSRSTSRGFTLLEMMCATVILLIALFAVAQLVPASITLNSRNRSDSGALVFAQRELDQMLEQPLVSTAFTDGQGNNCNLGNAGTPNTLVGSPVVVINNLAAINFSGTPLAGYSFTYQDPNSADGTTLDVRWAVITFVNGNIVTGKRFIIGVRQQGGNGFFLPVTLDSTVEK
jgi:prepilin-type N-terminal cleavage/methylation domain-containing protein